LRSALHDRSVIATTHPRVGTTVTAVGDLSGLAIGPDGHLLVAFSRIAQPGGASRIWLAKSPF